MAQWSPGNPRRSLHRPRRANLGGCTMTADETGKRSRPDVKATVSITESEMLVACLESQRRHILGDLEGLDEEALRRPVLPSGWTCLGLLGHLTNDVERFWLRCVVAGEQDAIEKKMADR